MHTNQSIPIRIVIHVEGGVVQAVLANMHSNVQVAIMDFDFSDDDDSVIVCDESSFIGHIEKPKLSVEKVDQVFEALGQTLSASRQQEQRYLAQKGQYCPICQSTNLMPNEPQFDGQECLCDILCIDCQESWTDRYVLAGYSQQTQG